MPGAAGQLHGNLALLALSGGGSVADDPARRQAATDLALRQDCARRLRPRGLLRAGRFCQGVRLAQVPGQDRVLGAGGQLQCDQTRLDARRRRLPERRRYLHRLHHARFPGQVHAVYGRTAGFNALDRRSRRLRRHDPRAAKHHQQHRQQGTGLATSGDAPHHRLSATNVLISAASGSERGSLSRSSRKSRPLPLAALIRRRRIMATATKQATSVLPKTEGLVGMNWDPIKLIVGSLGIFTKIDFNNREVKECYSTSSIFRGYSVFMRGKDPRDSHFITSRICGICGDNHATCAVYAQNMAFGVRPPNLGEWIINLGEAAEYMFDHNIYQDNLVGVDYCEQMVRETNPGVWEKAQKKEAPNAKLHGYKTIADIMTALNPFTGEFYRETLQMSRLTREMFCLMEGRHVHPSTLYPGGVGTAGTIQVFTDYLVRLMKYVEFMKKVVPLHDDLFNFFYEALPGYERVGERRVLLGCWGSFNDPY